MEESRIDFLVDFIYESDAIEGIENDYGELRREIEDGKEAGHVGAMLWLESLMRDRSRMLNKPEICNVQKLIVETQHLKSDEQKLSSRHIGHYRDVDVFIGGRMGAHVYRITSLMNILIYEMSNWRTEHKQHSFEKNIVILADFHSIFEHIHPFVDGNGRTGRAIVYYLFRCAGIEPFIFTNADKHETYYKCFDKQRDMRKYFLKRA